MKRRYTVVVATIAAVGVSAAGAATAGAAVKKNQIEIRGDIQVKIGHFLKLNQRFTPLKQRVKSGSTVTVKNKDKTGEPHTISFTEKKFLPGKDLEPNPAMMGLLGKAHGVPEDNPEGDPTILVVDNGVAVPEGGTLNADTGFTDTVMGDSAFIAPGQKSFSFKVTADSGSKLFYFCAIHPWMQGKIKVK